MSDAVTGIRTISPCGARCRDRPSARAHRIVCASVCWPQRHEDPEDDDADDRHQDQIAEGFHRCGQFFHGVERIFAKREPLFFAPLPGLITL